MEKSDLILLDGKSKYPDLFVSMHRLGYDREIKQAAKNLNLSIEPWKTIVHIATKIANYPRHLSIHPGGIVIAPKPITNYKCKNCRDRETILIKNVK